MALRTLKKAKAIKLSIRQVIDKAGAIAAKSKTDADVLKELRVKILTHAKQYKKGLVEGDKYVAVIDGTSSTDISLEAVWRDILYDVGLDLPGGKANLLRKAFDILDALVKPDVKAMKAYYKADMEVLNEFMTVTKKSYNKVTYHEAGTGFNNGNDRGLRNLDV